MNKEPIFLNLTDLDMIDRIVTHRFITNDEKIEAIEKLIIAKMDTLFGNDINVATESRIITDAYAYHYIAEEIEYAQEEKQCDHARAITHNLETKEMSIGVKPFEFCDQCGESIGDGNE